MTDKLIEALERIADMRTSGGDLIEMHREELRGIAKSALAAHRSQQEPAATEAKGVEVAVVESLGGPKNLPQLLWYVDFPNMAAMVKPGDKLYTCPAPSESEAKDAARYRWLREKERGVPAPAVYGPFTGLALHGDALDAAIDAALSASGKKGGA